jgi:hypothetical protein
MITWNRGVSMINLSGYTGEFFSVVSGDTAQRLPLDKLKDGRNPAIAAMISVSGADVRIRYDGIDVDTMGPAILLKDGSIFSIENWKSLQRLSFISAVSGNPATITVIPQFGSEV